MAMSLSHIGVTWVQFAVGMILFVFYWYIVHSVLGDWYFGTLDASQTALLEFGFLILPLGWMLFQSALHRLLVFQGQSYPNEVTIGFLLTCVVASCVIGFVFFFEWEGVALVSFDEDAEYPGLITMSIGLFLICMAFFVVLSLVALRLCLFTMYSSSHAYDALGDGAGSGEQRALLEMQDAETSAQGKGTGSGDQDDEKSASGGKAGASTKSKGGYGSALTSQRLAMDRMWQGYDRVMEYSSVCGFLVILLPGLLFLNGVMPSDWHYMYPAEIESYNLAETGAGWAVNVAYNYDDETYYMKIYGDLIIYFGFISIVSVLSWMAMKSLSTRMALRKRVFIPQLKFSMSVGQLLFWTFWVIFMFLEIYYWLGVHEFQSSNTKELTEVWARFFGVLAIIFLSFMFFTVSRIRLWNDCFGLSSDHLVLLHRVFAYSMLTCSYAHMLFWIIWFANNGTYTLDDNWIFVGSLPFTYNDDNFTIAIMQALMIFFVPFAYFLCSSSYVRRKFFEMFYVIHVYASLVFLVATLYHASQGWRYMLPCLVLYAIDRCLRFYNSTNFARIDSLECVKMGSSTNLECVTRIGFSVAQFGSTPSGDTRAFFGNVRYKMGQYCFINIPQISPFEWHPFTISSGPYQRQVTFHIKSMGDNEFSGKLAALHQGGGNDSVQAGGDKDQQRTVLQDTELYVDGPYGIPFSYEGYDRVVLVAGGIGITPCHSIFSGMLAQARAIANVKGTDSWTFWTDNMPSVDLIWMVRNPEMFDLFQDTWEECRSVNTEMGGDNDRFQLHFYHTKPSQQDAANVEILRAGIRYQAGRPTMVTALKFLEEKGDSKQLVFCCGPAGLAQDCEVSATQYGAHFYAESFDFSAGDDIKVGSITFGVLVVCLAILGAICGVY